MMAFDICKTSVYVVALVLHMKMKRKMMVAGMIKLIMDLQKGAKRLFGKIHYITFGGDCPSTPDCA